MQIFSKNKRCLGYLVCQKGAGAAPLPQPIPKLVSTNQSGKRTRRPEYRKAYRKKKIRSRILISSEDGSIKKTQTCVSYNPLSKSNSHFWNCLPRGTNSRRNRHAIAIVNGWEGFMAAFERNRRNQFFYTTAEQPVETFPNRPHPLILSGGASAFNERALWNLWNPPCGVF